MSSSGSRKEGENVEKIDDESETKEQQEKQQEQDQQDQQDQQDKQDQLNQQDQRELPVSIDFRSGDGGSREALKTSSDDDDDHVAALQQQQAPIATTIPATQVSTNVTKRTKRSKFNKNFSLIVVGFALLLDGMLNMVIVPIMPEYLKYFPASIARVASNNNNNKQFNNQSSSSSSDSSSHSLMLGEGAATGRMTDSGKFVYDEQDVAVGFLFALKPLIQLVASPCSGVLIDRVGFEAPMFVGLMIQFASTLIFTYTDSLMGLFASRSVQGIGSAMAATSGFTMITCFFNSYLERSKALGIVITALALGSFMSVPFSGFLFQYVGKKAPFQALACLSLFDAILLLISIYMFKCCGDVKTTVKRSTVVRQEATVVARDEETEEEVTPMEKRPVPKKYIWSLFLDPYVAICSVALIMANVPLAFTQPTIAIWMKKTMNATESEIGLIWLSGFFPHIFGVYMTVCLVKYFSQFQWLFLMCALTLEAISCLFIPFIKSYYVLFAPIMVITFSYGMIDTTVLPTMAFLVDTRHSSMYGSVYAIVDLSYSLCYAFGPMIAGVILHYVGFLGLTIIVACLILGFTPFIYKLRRIYEEKRAYDLQSSETAKENQIKSANTSQIVAETVLDIVSQSQQQEITTNVINNESMSAKRRSTDNGVAAGINYIRID